MVLQLVYVSVDQEILLYGPSTEHRFESLWLGIGDPIPPGLSQAKLEGLMVLAVFVDRAQSHSWHHRIFIPPNEDC